VNNIKVIGKNNTPRDKSHHAWKGDSVGHSSLHTWLRTNHGKANKCCCKECDGSSKIYEWANLSGEYKRDVNDFRMMCRKCHSLMDKSVSCKKGHKRTEENTKIEKSGYRRCLECFRINVEEYKPRRRMMRKKICQ